LQPRSGLRQACLAGLLAVVLEEGVDVPRVPLQEIEEWLLAHDGQADQLAAD
jgi:hypothetical protein